MINNVKVLPVIDTSDETSPAIQRCFKASFSLIQQENI